MLTINYKLLNFNDGDKLLDVGCGEGRHVIHACLEHNILGVGVDLSLRDLTTARERFMPFANYNSQSQFNLQQTDATKLPFADSSFDKIICSDGGALPEVVGNAAFMVKAGDVAELVNALRTLLTNEAMCEQLSIVGRAHSLQHLSWQVVGEQLSNYYRQILALKSNA